MQPHRVEIARARHPEQRRQLARVVRRRFAVDLHPLQLAAGAREREARRHPGRLHAGKTGQAVHRPGELPVEASFRRFRLDERFRVRGARAERDGVPRAGGDHVGRVVAAIEGDEADEAGEEKTRSHQEHEGQRHLRGGQDGTRPVGAQQTEAARGPRVPLDEGSEQAASGRLERGDGAEQQSDRHRQPEREGEDDAVEPDLVQPRHRDRHQRGHGAKHGGGRRQPQRAAAQAQQDALGEELTHDPAPAGPQRSADRELAPAGHPAREQQSRDVDAGDEQHEQGGPGQRHERRPVLADHLLQQRNHPRHPGVLRRAPTSVPVRTPGVVVHALQDGADLGRGPLRRDPLPEPSHRDGGRHVGPEHVGRPDLHAGPGEVEPLGEHPHHGAGFVVGVDDGSDDVWIGVEAPGPGVVAEQHDPVRPAPRLVVGEEPPEVRPRPEQPQQPRRDRRAPRPGAVRRDPLERERPVCRELLERLGLFLHPLDRAGAQERPSRPLRERLPDAHDAPGVGIRQRPYQQAVDDAEHRGGGASAQREDEHHRGREAGRPPEAADGVAQVAPQVVEPAPAPHVARPLANRGGVAQPPTRRAQGFVLGDADVALTFALQLQVEPELLLQVLLGLAPAEIRQQPAEPGRRLHRGASPAPAGCMTRPTASTIRSHFVASRRSCPRPVSVRA